MESYTDLDLHFSLLASFATKASKQIGLIIKSIFCQLPN